MTGKGCCECSLIMSLILHIGIKVRLVYLKKSAMNEGMNRLGA